MSAFQLRRLKVLMEREAGNPLEALGVLNPAAVRGPNGELYLFPRIVATTRMPVSSPLAIPNHAGKMQLAMLHRPLFAGTRPEETARGSASRLADLDHESIWISYCPMTLEGRGPPRLGLFNSHHRLATPVSRREMLKIGGGGWPTIASA